MREIPKPGERYRHFKNKEYQILAVATHSETGEKMVVYQALYGEYGVWVRPLSMFMEEVDRVKYPEAAQRYRFERIAAGPWENSKQQEIRTTRTTHVVNEGVRRSKMSDAATIPGTYRRGTGAASACGRISGSGNDRGQAGSGPENERQGGQAGSDSLCFRLI